MTLMKKLVILFVTAAIVTAAVVWLSAPGAQQGGEAAGSDAQRRQTVIFDIDGGRVADPQMWNPFVPGHRGDQGFWQALYEPLFLLNYESGRIEPWLGVSLASNDALDVWTLRLRDGIAWSDGEPFDADDVVFTVSMLKRNAPQLMHAAVMDQWVERVVRVDDRTVRFDLRKPNPRFGLDYLTVKIGSSIPIVPEHVWADLDPMTFSNYDPQRGWPVATGPYRPTSVGQTRFVYERNENWWGATTGWKPLPQPRYLVWVWYGPEETRTAAMAQDRLDSLMDITLGAFGALQKRNPNVVAWKQSLPYAWLDPCSRTLEFCHQRPPWDDKQMRWAVNFAIDREQIVDIAYEGTTQASEHFFPASPPLNRLVERLKKAGLYDKFPLTLHDPQRTRQILEAKGFSRNGAYYEKDGQPLSLDITTHEAFIEKQRIAQVIVEQLQRVGIHATTRNQAGGTWAEDFQHGHFEARMAWSACGSVSEPWSSLDRFNARWLVPVGERAQANGWRWRNEPFSALVDEMGTLPLDDERVGELFEQAMAIWLAELPVIPITQAKKLIPFSTTYWTGWPTAQNNYLHSPTWWQSTHKIIHELRPAGAGEEPQMQDAHGSEQTEPLIRTNYH